MGFGVSSVIVQAVLARELLSVLHGSELCLGLVFGAWLLWIGLGARIGAVAARSVAAPWLFGLGGLVAAVVPFAQVAAIREARLLLRIPTGEYVPLAQAALLILVAAAPFSAMIGLTFPLGARLYAGSIEADARPVGRLYAAEAVGFLVGGLAYTFVLLTRLSAFGVLEVVMAVLCAAMVSVCVGLHRGKPCPAFLGVIAALAMVLGGTVGWRSAEWDQATRMGRWAGLAPSPGCRLVRVVDTPYQNVMLSEYDGLYTVYANGQTCVSFPDPYQSGLEANFVLLQHPSPRRVLLLGWGAEGLIQEMLKSPLELIDYVQVDEGLLRAVEAFLAPGDRAALASPRVHVHHVDARVYVQHARDRYDVVFANVGDPSTAALNRYFTTEFFEEVRRILAPGGVFATRVSSAVNVVGEEIGLHTGAVYHSLRQVFPHVLVTWDTANYLFATEERGVLSADPQVIGRRFQKRGIITEYFSDAHPEILLPEGRAEAIHSALDDARFYHLNTDREPVSYFYNLLLWDRFSESNFGPALRRLRAAGVGTWLLGVAILVALRLAWGRARRWSRSTADRADSAVAIFACGLAAMGFEVVYLFSFQNLFGSLYTRLALVVAAFMCGLALGGMWATKGLSLWARPPRTWLIGVCMASAAFAVGITPEVLSVARVLAASWPPVAAGVLVFGVALAGLLTGAAFPLAAAVHLESGPGATARSAGAMQAADHLGGALGAAAIGSLLIPVLGVGSALWVIAAWSLAGAIVLVRRRHPQP